MLTPEALKSFLLDMPRGHIFDLTYPLFADVFPPGPHDSAARDQLHKLAEECDCSVADNEAEGRFELTRR